MPQTVTDRDLNQCVNRLRDPLGPDHVVRDDADLGDLRWRITPVRLSWVVNGGKILNC